MYDILAARAWRRRVAAGSRCRSSLDAVAASFAAELTPARKSFLVAATQLINEQGYRGASVDKISARLNVTKGSFYHYNETKDDLVVDCFKRSFETMRRVQRAVWRSASDDHWIKLATIGARRWSTISCPTAARCCAPRRSPRCLQSMLRWRWSRRPTGCRDRFAALISDGIAVRLGARGGSVHRGTDAHRDAERLRRNPLVDPGRRPRAGARAVREAGADRDLLQVAKEAPADSHRPALPGLLRRRDQLPKRNCTSRPYVRGAVSDTVRLCVPHADEDAPADSKPSSSKALLTNAMSV